MSDKKPIVNQNGIPHELTNGDRLEIPGSLIVGTDGGVPLTVDVDSNQVEIGVNGKTLMNYSDSSGIIRMPNTVGFFYDGAGAGFISAQSINGAIALGKDALSSTGICVNTVAIGSGALKLNDTIIRDYTGVEDDGSGNAKFLLADTSGLRVGDTLFCNVYTGQPPYNVITQILSIDPNVSVTTNTPFTGDAASGLISLHESVGNTAIGSEAMNHMLQGSNNTAIGAFAGDDITSGRGNTFIGFNSGDVFGNNPENCIDIVNAIGRGLHFDGATETWTFDGVANVQLSGGVGELNSVIPTHILGSLNTDEPYPLSGVLTISSYDDGTPIQTGDGDVVLVTAQNNSDENGFYTTASGGDWTPIYTTQDLLRKDYWVVEHDRISTGGYPNNIYFLKFDSTGHIDAKSFYVLRGMDAATNTEIGAVKPDGTTITVDNNGVISATGGGGGGGEQIATFDEYNVNEPLLGYTNAAPSGVQTVVSFATGQAVNTSDDEFVYVVQQVDSQDNGIYKTVSSGDWSPMILAAELHSKPVWALDAHKTVQQDPYGEGRVFLSKFDVDGNHTLVRMVLSQAPDVSTFAQKGVENWFGISYQEVTLSGVQSVISNATGLPADTSDNEIVYIHHQSDSSQNGIYKTNSGGAWERKLSNLDLSVKPLWIFDAHTTLYPDASGENKSVFAKFDSDGQVSYSVLALSEASGGGGIAEAPNDGQEYVRKNEAWAVSTGGGITEAPNDGQEYVRKNEAWATVNARLQDMGFAAPILGTATSNIDLNGVQSITSLVGGSPVDTTNGELVYVNAQTLVSENGFYVTNDSANWTKVYDSENLKARDYWITESEKMFGESFNDRYSLIKFATDGTIADRKDVLRKHIDPIGLVKVILDADQQTRTTICNLLNCMGGNIDPTPLQFIAESIEGKDLWLGLPLTSYTAIVTVTDLSDVELDTFNVVLGYLPNITAASYGETTVKVNIFFLGVPASKVGFDGNFSEVTQWGSTEMPNGIGLTSPTLTTVPNVAPPSATDFSGMFYYCTGFDQSIDGWDVSRVMNMQHMFVGCDAYNQSMNSWNTQSVLNMGLMFEHCAAFNGDISNWNTSNLQKANSMFYGSTAFNQNIGAWNVGNLQDAQDMFSDATAFNQDISNWHIANITIESGVGTGFEGMFCNASSFNQDLSKWCVEGVTAGEPSNFSTGASSWVLDKPDWGAACAGLPPGDPWVPPETGGGDPIPGGGGGGGGSQNGPIYKFTNPAGGTTLAANMFAEGGKFYWFEGRWVYVVKDRADLQLILEKWKTGDAGTRQIDGLNGSYTINAQDLITSRVTQMQNLFAQWSGANIYIGNWDTSNVTDMQSMFSSAGAKMPDVSYIGGWDVSKVTDMAEMFRNTVFNEPIGTWNVSNVTNMAGMFGTATKFNQNINSWNVGKVTNMSSMFYMARAYNQSMNSWDVSKVTNFEQMFMGGSHQFNGNITSWNTSSALYMNNMFNQNPSFNQNIGAWDTHNVTGMQAMFVEATAFNQDLSGWCVSQFATEPYGFKSGATAWVQPKPNWGAPC